MSGPLRNRAYLPGMPALINGALFFSLALTVGTFALYLAGTVSEPGFTDRTLLALLGVLRILGFFLCALSLSALICGVWRGSSRRGRVLNLALYVITGIMGTALMIMNAFFAAITGGNG
jgi:hypothetical protein